MSSSSGGSATPGRTPGIPGYDDLEVVGRGGFATVYRAHEPAFNRDVAIKVLDVADVSEEARLRFERECRAVGSLSGHPGIVTVFGAGTTSQGSPYIVMEYMPGGSLASWLRGGRRLTPAEAVSVGIDLLDAVGAAHEIGIVHRDIKPANVLVSRYGRPQLGDFGISSVPGAYETRSGAAAATLAFAAPEALDGRKASPASDLYSLAATLSTLITGRAIFGRDGEDSVVAYLSRIAHDAPPDLTAAGVSPELNAVVLRALAKAPADRYADAAAFAEALARVPEHTGIPLRLTPPEAAAGSPSRHELPTMRPVGSADTRPEPTPAAETLDVPRPPVDAARAELPTQRKDLPAVTGRIVVEPRRAPRRKLYAAGGLAAVVLLGAAAAAAAALGSGAHPKQLAVPVTGPAVTATCTGLACRLRATQHAGASYVWSFGDGTSVAGTSEVTHTYASVGSFAVQAQLTLHGQSAAGPATTVVIQSFSRTLRLLGGQLTVTVGPSRPTPCGTAAQLQLQAGGAWTAARRVTLGAHRQTLSVPAGVYRLQVAGANVADGVCAAATSKPVTVTAPAPVVPHASGGLTGGSVTGGTSTGPMPPKKYQPVKPR